MKNGTFHTLLNVALLIAVAILVSSCPNPLDNHTDDIVDTDATPDIPDEGDQDSPEEAPVVDPADDAGTTSRISSYAVYYGPLDSTSVAALKAYDLVIVHPDQAMNSTPGISVALLRASVQELKAAGVTVIAYVSVGEDLRVRTYFHPYDATYYPDLPDDGWLHPDWSSLQTDGRFYKSWPTDLNFVGPVVDPRGALDGGGALDSYYRWPYQTDKGWASYYLDDADRNWVPSLNPDLPDYNRYFGAFFVNVGDRLWYETLRDQTRSFDGLFGMDELLSSDGLGFDGLFLDTIDTMGPNTYTKSGDPVPSEYEWTAPGLLYFIQNVKRDYPDTLIVQNRGLFFFDPRLAHYKHSARGLIDFVMFESYRLDSSADTDVDTSTYYRENQKRIRQALMVEASRPDGFQVLSLGYVAEATDENEVQADIAEATSSGFVHYITNPDITEIRTDALTARTVLDTLAPVWSSTGYVNNDVWPDAYTEDLVAREGIRLTDWGYLSGYDATGLRLYYDVALDRNPVSYIVYCFNLTQGTAINPDTVWGAEPWLKWDTWLHDGPEWQEFFSRAEAIQVTTRVRPEYENQYGAPAPDPANANDPPLAYWSEVPRIQPGVPYLLLLRARDSGGNETSNRNLALIEMP